jgi:hypothetical protein
MRVSYYNYLVSNVGVYSKARTYARNYQMYILNFYRSKEGLFVESAEGKRVDLIAHRPKWWPPSD